MNVQTTMLFSDCKLQIADLRRRTMKRAIISIAVVFAVGVSTLGQEEKTRTLDVWPGQAPGETGKIGPEKFLDAQPGQRTVKRLTNVSKPTITIYRPAKSKETAAVLIAPGGGYSILAWGLEGTEVADCLNSIGITGIVIKYRVPKRQDLDKYTPPLQDAQRAMSMVRSKAKVSRSDPQRIGMLGLSAGGPLTASTATQ